MLGDWMKMATAPAAVAPRRAPPTAYAELRRTIQAAGLLQRRYDYYVARTLGCYALFAFGLALGVVLPPTLGWSMVTAFTLGLASIQIGMLGHDAGHLAVFRSARAN